MNLSLVLSQSFRRTLLCVGVGVVFALGCNSGPMQMDIVVEEPACIDGAFSMTFTVLGSQPINLVTYQGGSPNVVGTPTIIQGTNNFDVIAELNGVPVNQPVMLKFSGISSMNASFNIQDVQFYPVPPAQLPHPPICPPTQGPVIGGNDLPGSGQVIEVSNGSLVPIEMLQLELVSVPSPLPSSALQWGNPMLESLPWQQPFPGPIVMAPGTPPIVADVPDSAPPGHTAVLMRYTAQYGLGLHRAIAQADITNDPVATEKTTWGAVKSLYRGN